MDHEKLPECETTFKEHGDDLTDLKELVHNHYTEINKRTVQTAEAIPWIKWALGGLFALILVVLGAVLGT